MRRLHFNPFRLRAIREQLGMSREELGVALGYRRELARNVLWRLESGQVSRPRAHIRSALSEALGVPEELFMTNPRDYFDCEAATLEYDSDGLSKPLYEHLAEHAPMEGW